MNCKKIAFSLYKVARRGLIILMDMYLTKKEKKKRPNGCDILSQVSSSPSQKKLFKKRAQVFLFGLLCMVKRSYKHLFFFFFFKRSYKHLSTIVTTLCIV